MNVLIIILIFQTLGYLYLAYRWITNMPTKDKLNKTQASIEVMQAKLKRIKNYEVGSDIRSILDDLSE